MKERLSLLDLKGKILFTDKPSLDLVERLSTCLDGFLKNFENKLFVSKNKKLEAVIIPIEEYERMKEAYEYVENMEIARIVEERKDSKTITFEELLERRGINKG